VCDELYIPREIPPERRDFGSHFEDNIKLAALFDPSEKYQLVETYGLDCYTETDEGLLFELCFTNRDYLIKWLLGFGDKVKVLEPDDVAEEIKGIAEKIILHYK
jgi:predicted DNA-binding transcriptional regulator YafY